MRVALAGLIAAVVVACGGNGNPGDGDGSGSITGDPSTLTCEQLRDALAAEVGSTSRACTTTSDCTTVGAASKFGSPTCDCAPSYGYACWGNPVNGDAWLADARAQALDREWRDRCVPQGCANQVCVCDCGYDPAECRDGFCRNDIPNCFPNLIDAAVDGPPADA